jgi:hypothetical protein
MINSAEFRLVKRLDGWHHFKAKKPIAEKILGERLS